MEEYMIDDVIIENAEELEYLKYEENDGQPVFARVRVTKKDFSIFELHRKYKKGKLILDVDFQRKVVWEDRQNCELIESILMGLPLPIFYFKQQDDSVYVVVDGKQRLSALFDYLENKYALRGLKILDFLNGKKFDDLTTEFGIYQSQLEDYQVYSHVILPPTPDKILYDIFDRVNRGGTKLNKQEIRNALYHGKGLEMLHGITETEEFVLATRIEKEKDSRMKGAYLLTRFFSFYLLYHDLLMQNGKFYEYNGDIDELLTLSLGYLNDCSEYDLQNLRQIALDNLKTAFMILGRGAFRKEWNESKPINMNIFETTLYFMVLINERTYDMPDRQIKEKLYQLITSHDYLDSIGNSRDNYIKVDKRFKMMRILAQEVCYD